MRKLIASIITAIAIAMVHHYRRVRELRKHYELNQTGHTAYDRMKLEIPPNYARTERLRSTKVDEASAPLSNKYHYSENVPRTAPSGYTTVLGRLVLPATPDDLQNYMIDSDKDPSFIHFIMDKVHVGDDGYILRSADHPLARVYLRKIIYK